MGKKKAEANSDGSNWSDHPSDDESDDEWADDDDDRRGSRGGLQGRGGKSAGKFARRGGGGTSSRSGLAVGGKGSGASGGRAGPDGRASKGQTKAPSAVDDEEDEDVDDIDDDGDDDDDGDGDGGSQDGEATKEVTEEWEFVLPDFPREPSSICWSESGVIAVNVGTGVTLLDPAEGISTSIQSSPEHAQSEIPRYNDWDSHASTSRVLTDLVRRDNLGLVTASAWSPMGAAPDGGCALVACWADGTVTVYCPPAHTMSPEWIPALSMSGAVYDACKHVDFGRKLNAGPAVVPQVDGCEDMVLVAIPQVDGEGGVDEAEGGGDAGCAQAAGGRRGGRNAPKPLRFLDPEPAKPKEKPKKAAPKPSNTGGGGGQEPKASAEVKPGKKERGDGGSAATEGVAAAAPVSGGKGKVEEQEDGTVCMRCEEKTDQDRMLLCDVCDSPWHLECVIPALYAIPQGDWVCERCSEPKKESKKRGRSPAAGRAASVGVKGSKVPAEKKGGAGEEVGEMAVDDGLLKAVAAANAGTVSGVEGVQGGEKVCEEQGGEATAGGSGGGEAVSEGEMEKNAGEEGADQMQSSKDVETGDNLGGSGVGEGVEEMQSSKDVETGDNLGGSGVGEGVEEIEGENVADKGEVAREEGQAAQEVEGVGGDDAAQVEGGLKEGEGVTADDGEAADVDAALDAALVQGGATQSQGEGGVVQGGATQSQGEGGVKSDGEAKQEEDAKETYASFFAAMLMSAGEPAPAPVPVTIYIKDDNEEEEEGEKEEGGGDGGTDGGKAKEGGKAKPKPKPSKKASKKKEAVVVSAQPLGEQSALVGEDGNPVAVAVAVAVPVPWALPEGWHPPMALEIWDPPCLVCGSSEDPDSTLLCDGCDGAFHLACVKLDAVPEGDWLCRKCRRNAQKRESDRRRRGAARQEAEAAKQAATAARAARDAEKKKKKQQDTAGKKEVEQEAGAGGTRGEENEGEDENVIDIDAVGVEVGGSLGALIPDSWSSGIVGASDTGQTGGASGKRRLKEVKQLYTPEASFRKKEKPSFKKEKAISKKGGRSSAKREAEGDGEGEGEGEEDEEVDGGRDEMMVFDEGEVDEDDMLVDEDEYVADEAEDGEDSELDDEGRPVKKRRFRGPGKKIGRKKKPGSTGGGKGGHGGKGQRRAQPLASGGGVSTEEIARQQACVAVKCARFLSVPVLASDLGLQGEGHRSVLALCSQLLVTVWAVTLTPKGKEVADLLGVIMPTCRQGVSCATFILGGGEGVFGLAVADAAGMVEVWEQTVSGGKGSIRKRDGGRVCDAGHGMVSCMESLGGDGIAYSKGRGVYVWMGGRGMHLGDVSEGGKVTGLSVGGGGGYVFASSSKGDVWVWRVSADEGGGAAVWNRKAFEGGCMGVAASYHGLYGASIARVRPDAALAGEDETAVKGGTRGGTWSLQGVVKVARARDGEQGVGTDTSALIETASGRGTLQGGTPPPLARGTPLWWWDIYQELKRRYDDATRPALIAQARVATASPTGAVGGKFGSFGGKLLAALAKEGEEWALDMLLALGAGVGEVEKGGQTALAMAAIGGNAGVVSLLIAHRADVGAKDCDGLTALDWSGIMKRSEVSRLLEQAASA